ncbi:MAG: 30S ribosomal protein S6 [Thermodesulfovibrionales bacterium]|nr:30S ribosomal protein S6 [Thermodesulfovibrionales bacterium]
MNLYECITIIDAGLTDEAITEASEKIQGIITNGGGEILKADPWGRRKLSYEINHHSRGFYLLLLYRAPSDVNKKLEDTFKVYDPIIKHMIVRLEKKQAASALKALEEAKKALEEAKKAPAEVPAEAEAAEAAPATEEAAPAETTKPADTTKQE